MATDKEINARLVNKYGITKPEYDAESKDGCAVCYRPGKTRGLHVDHDHSVHKVKVTCERQGEGWSATAEYRRVIFYGWGRKRAEAVAEVRQKLKRASVRGVLCIHHNRGLQMFQDNPEYLDRAAQYLRKFEESNV